MKQAVPILYEILCGVASTHSIVYYSDLADAVGLPPIALGKPLGEINEREHNQERPMLSAVVLSKDFDTSSDGFFELAKSMRGYDGTNGYKFWEEELECVYDHWGRA